MRNSCIPLGLVLCIYLALRVVTNVADVHVTSEIELFGAEHRHDGGGSRGLAANNVVARVNCEEVEMAAKTSAPNKSKGRIHRESSGGSTTKYIIDLLVAFTIVLFWHYTFRLLC